MATALNDVEVRLYLSTNVSSKHQKKRNKSQGIKGYQKGICYRHWFIMMQRPYKQICSQGKGERYLVPILLNQIGLGTQLRRISKGKVINHLMFQVIFGIFFVDNGITG